MRQRLVRRVVGSKNGRTDIDGKSSGWRKIFRLDDQDLTSGDAEGPVAIASLRLRHAHRFFGRGRHLLLHNCSSQDRKGD